MAEVDIGNETYQSFASTDEAATYIGADVRYADQWAALTAKEEGRFLVTATRILLRLAWPTAAPSLDAPPNEVRDATCEFAAAIMGGYDLGVAPASVLQIKRQKAGTVEAEYFRDFDSPAYQPPPLPQPVWDLLRALLVPADSGAAFLPGAIATGVSGCGYGYRDYTLDPYRPYQGRDWN